MLVVDDDLLMSELLCLQLEQLGCAVDHVDGGHAALALLEHKDVHLLISDWQMPQMDGLELVCEARARTSAESHLHIVMMTARQDEQVIRRALEAGVDDFLYKPFAQVELELAIASARRNRMLHRRLRRRAALLARAHDQTRQALRRVQQDIDAAARLHEQLLPDRSDFGTFRIGTLYRPAASLGGDTVGVCQLPGGILFFVIDVMGHGVPAALTSFHLHHRLKQLGPATPEALEMAIATINREIHAAADESYATMLCGLARADDDHVLLICAGHPPAIVSHAGSATEVALTGAPPLGMFDDTAFPTERVPLPMGSRLALYSDGLTDALPDQDLPALLGGAGDERLDQLIARLDNAVGARQPDLEIADDISLLMIERLAQERIDE